ncbi:Aconitate hydratase large subunit (EC [Olavius sp. associated proteobacterium Delta 1]|nr:Aconitate hydratase large subunit (EC [Olavius sp. associated proteobacterium Delta 1]
MGQTIVEKIISAHAAKKVYQDDIVIVPVDGAMASDTTAPLTIKAFREMGGKKVWRPDRCFLVIDHAAPAPNERIANLHVMMREFAREQDCVLYEAGIGICHQLMIEEHIVRHGQIFIGADSHSTAYGAVGALGSGVGSTDLAAVLLTGKIWLKVPRSIKIELIGKIPPAIQSKDLILNVIGQTGIAGATYLSMEFAGEAVSELSLSSRITMANMMIEAGAKTGFVHPNGLELPYSFSPIYPDPDATYQQTITIDASQMQPMISQPHSPDSVIPVDQIAGKKVDYAFIGTCVNGRLEDLQIAAGILKDVKVHPQTRLAIGPASRQVFLDAVKDGTAAILTEAGATFIPPGCGPCVGTHSGVPGNGETVISAGNRNFKGRMGNPNAMIYLASPATVAASARDGKITNPIKYL